MKSFFNAVELWTGLFQYLLYRQLPYKIATLMQAPVVPGKINSPVESRCEGTVTL